jgi:hypothetical protein
LLTILIETAPLMRGDVAELIEDYDALAAAYVRLMTGWGEDITPREDSAVEPSEGKL